MSNYEQPFSLHDATMHYRIFTTLLQLGAAPMQDEQEKNMPRHVFLSYLPALLMFFPLLPFSLVFRQLLHRHEHHTHHSNSRNIAYETTTVTLGTF